MALCLASCEKKEEVVSLQIYFTGDVNGRLEPCGCFTGQYGGLTRIDTWLEHKDPAGTAIRLDVGDALKGTADYDQIHYEYLADAFEKLKFSALNIGAREAALSREELTRIFTETGAPMVSANVWDVEYDQTLVPSYRMIESRKKKIAVLGLLDPETVRSTLGDGLVVKSMETTLTNLLPTIEAKEKPDLTILLCFADEPKMRELAKKFYELDIILGGDVPQPSQEMIVENESIILYTTNQARAVGDLSFSLSGGSVSEPKFDIHLMAENIPQSKELLELSKAYRNLIRNTSLDIDNPASIDDDSIIPGGGTTHSYVGSQVCGTCHPSAMKVWENSQHAHAFPTLVKGGTDADPNCIGCHTVGFGEESGYRREFDGKKLTNVGCESCHGPGSEHVAQRALGDPAKVTFHFRPLGASQCTKCHHGEFSRPFNWDEFWPVVAHGKEGEVEK